MNRFGALHDPAQGHRFDPGKFAHSGEPSIVQFAWPATRMSADQANEPFLFPGVALVVDRLATYPALLVNRSRMFAFAQLQQTRCTQPRIPPRIIGRHLEQGFAFAGAQPRGYFNQALSGVKS